MQATATGLRASVLRFSTVYGSATDHPDRVIPAFCRAVIQGLPLMVEGAENHLDITHVSDVSEGTANVVRLLSEGKSLAPRHLTTGQGISLPNLASAVVCLVRSRSEIIITAPRDFDVARFVGDPRFARIQIGWHPEMPLEAGVTDVIRQFICRRKI